MNLARVLRIKNGMDPKERFSDRATAYHAHRPRYPRQLLAELEQRCGLTPESVIADMGSGTGILTELFLEHGNTVFAVEPNAPMRAIAEENLRGNPRFHSVAATAEETTLASESVDLIVAGQAFHWFERSRAQAEFARILRPQGWIVLVWNERVPDSTPFAAAYEAVLTQHSVDYTVMDPKKVSRDNHGISDFLGPKMQVIHLRHQSRVTFEQLSGLAASASYAPLPGHAKYEGFSRALSEAFHAYAEDGTVPLDYEMKAYVAPRFDFQQG